MITIESQKYQLQYTIYKKKVKIHYLGVKRKFQGQGVGKKVILDLIKKVQKLNIKQIEIDAYAMALDFWKKLGFVINEQPQIKKGWVQDYHDGYLTIK